ncbi:MAG: radical SAM/SPASM domain-containing protein [Proteobacteria bacterium]|nr:MAG: radical SAM/SPASM domain-containing protein [Pseudomonadota bacterium]PIE18063.1 MAG: radical SAM/SPASM domain-containing protein [Pseudomonadota bacterium]
MSDLPPIARPEASPREGEESFIPKWIAWESTRRCNLGCVHCRCSSELSSSSGRFDTAAAKQLIDDICVVSKPVFVLSGGEPLMRGDIFEIAEHGRARGLRVCMATNGTLVTDETCRQLKAAQIRIVSLSLDGPTAEIHDDFRQQEGAYEGTLRAAALFANHGIEFIVNSSFSKRNQPHIADTFRLAKSIGAKAWYMFMIVPTGRGEEIMAELISKEDYEEILEWHYHQEKAEEEILMRPTCAPHYYRVVPQLNRQEGRAFKRRSLSFSTGGGKGCLAAQSICLIDCMGDVKPCSYFPLSAGNVREQSFESIWWGSKLFSDLRQFERYKGSCGSCEYLRVCGGCRARAYAVTGDYMAPEPFCDYLPGNAPKGPVIQR